MKLYDNDAYREEFMALVYGLLMSDGINDRANQIIDAFDMAPAVEAELLLPNAPLTFEELREMDGEPVWIMETEIGRSYWAIVKDVRDLEVGLCTVTDPEDYGIFGLYGKTWIAYRRKPGKGERA